MKHTSRVLVTAVILSIILGFGLPSGTNAQEASTQADGNGLKIAPVRNDLTIEPGKSQTVSIFVENVTNASLTLRPIVNDFTAGDDETGEPKLLLDDNAAAPSNSFKAIITQNLTNVTLGAKERKEMKVTLAVPAGAAGGGYYGAVRFAPVMGDEDQSTVSLTASVGSIFLVRVPGDITEQLSVSGFSAAKNGSSGGFFNSSPTSIITRFKNSGNIHVQPFGKITIKDWRGNKIQEIEVNDTNPRGNVLPDSIRKFEDVIDKTLRFGRYTVEGNFGYGNNGELLSVKSTFYVIPYLLIGVVIAIIAFLILGLPRLIRAYNRRVVAQSRHKKRR